MIAQKEIIKVAEAERVPKSTIDKDWILGHYLNAMYSLPEIKEKFVFKGGTCIRKCFIQDYRFSEDIDITLTDDKIVINKKLINKFNDIAENNSNAKFHIEYIIPKKSDDVDQGYEVKIKFWGADHHPNQMPLPPNRWQTSIKLDISYSEKLILETENKSIIHKYSDNHKTINNIRTYCLNEIIAEKIRSLIQRNRPRDIYDSWYLLSKTEQSQFPEIKEVLLKKAYHKNIEIKDVGQFINPSKIIINKGAWESSLKHQLGQENLPDFELVYNQLEKLLEKFIKY